MIVITGAAGFIGSCILSRFNEIGIEDIFVVDHLDDDQKKENLKNKKFVQFFDKKDFIELIRKDQLSQRIDAVIHMGACSSTILQDAQYFEENNFKYSRDLAVWCLKRGVRFIYASSAATYGDGSCGYSDSDKTTRILRPLNLYGESKQKFDLWVLDQPSKDFLVGLKFFNVFGPNEYHKKEMRSVILKAFAGVKEKGHMVLFKSYKKEYGDGTQRRDFIYIKDAVDMVMFFYDHPSVCGIFNVGTGHARTWNDLADALFMAVGKKPNIEYIEMPEILRDKYQYFTQAEMIKIKNAGYDKPCRSLEDSIKDYVSYLDKNAFL